jgi:hypothetical protein
LEEFFCPLGGVATIQDHKRPGQAVAAAVGSVLVLKVGCFPVGAGILTCPLALAVAAAAVDFLVEMALLAPVVAVADQALLLLNSMSSKNHDLRNT